MNAFTRVITTADSISDTLTLTMSRRQRSRQRARLDRSGTSVALMLPRGTVLRGGDLLQAEDGRVIEVIAAPERLSVAATDDLLLLSRLAYHLGNRHIPVEVGSGWLRYREDHVLDEMVKAMGATVCRGEHPFEPEPGAYHHGLHTPTCPDGDGQGPAHEHAR